MDADLELLLISTADDLLPQAPRNAQRRLTDAEVLTLCVAQVVTDEPSDRRFLRAAKRQIGELFPYLPSQSALHKRRAVLREAFEWLCAVFAERSPGACDPPPSRMVERLGGAWFRGVFRSTRRVVGGAAAARCSRYGRGAPPRARSAHRAVARRTCRHRLRSCGAA